jgi:hypothetical protein
LGRHPQIQALAKAVIMILFFTIVTLIVPVIILAGLVVFAARDARASRKPHGGRH